MITCMYNGFTLLYFWSASRWAGNVLERMEVRLHDVNNELLKFFRITMIGKKRLIGLLQTYGMIFCEWLYRTIVWIILYHLIVKKIRNGAHKRSSRIIFETVQCSVMITPYFYILFLFIFRFIKNSKWQVPSQPQNGPDTVPSGCQNKQRREPSCCKNRREKCRPDLKIDGKSALRVSK